MSSTADEQRPGGAQPSFPFDDATVAPTGPALDAVSAIRTLAATDVAALTDDECLGVFDQLELLHRGLAAVGAGVLGEIEARDLCDRRYGSSPRVWYERRHGRSRSAVGKAAATAKRLRATLPDLAAALADGRISAERVELIASKVNDRNADAMAAAQQALLDLSAAELSFRQFAALIDDLARYADADGGHDPAEASSKVFTRRTGDQLVMGGTWVGPDGESFEQLLEAATSRLWRKWRTDLEQCPELTAPSRSAMRAQALLELVRHGAAATAPQAKPAVTELSLIIDADRVDELDPILAAALDSTGIARLLDRHSCDDECHDGDCGIGVRATGVSQIVGMPVSTTDGNRVWFTAQQWELLVCNADISEVLLDRLGMPVAVRERLRHPNRAMRRTLVARDGGCVFPGCDAPPGWCDAHHVIHYLPDGATVTVNLVLLCRRHHGIVHRSGWSIALNSGVQLDDSGRLLHQERHVDGLFTITTARGLRLQTQHRRRAVRPPDRQPVLA